ncbi:MAG: MFS transporter [Deltaproteobacteria bacterium]|nr:MFS transporter [Deltaproteobacteria bacterium]
MALANFFAMSSFGSFFLFPLFISERGGSKADIGIMMGAFALSSVLCRPYISQMVDRIGRKRSYSIGCLIMACLPLVYLWFQGELSGFYLPLLLVRLVHGVGLAICFTAAFTYIVDVIPPSRLNEGIGMFGVTGLLALGVGPLIAEIIVRDFGFNMFFVSASVLGAAGLVLHQPLPESYLKSDGTDVPSFFSVLFQRRTFVVASLSLLFGFGLAASGGFVAPFAKENHLTFVSLYYLSYSSAAIVTRVFGGKFADRVGEERILPYALTLTALGLWLLIVLWGDSTLLVSGLLSGCGHGFLFPCLNALVIRDQPIHIRGKVTGVFTGSIDTGAFAGSILLGYIGESAGYGALFFVAGLSLLAGLAIYPRQPTRT